MTSHNRARFEIKDAADGELSAELLRGGTVNPRRGKRGGPPLRAGYQLGAGRENTIPHQPQRAAGRRDRDRRVPAVRGHRALARPRAPRLPPGGPAASSPRRGGRGRAGRRAGRAARPPARPWQRGPAAVRGRG